MSVAEPAPGHRSGLAAVVGRPNVGKSTLVNAMVGEKIAIVTDVPGTTRTAIRGIVTRPDAQLIFVDTPGLAKPRTLLGRRLNELVHEVWRGVDVVCLVVDAEAGIGRGDRFLADELARVPVPVVCVVNKEDRARGDAMAPVLTAAADLGSFTDIVPASALDGFNVAHLLDVLTGYLPEGPRLFPTGAVSDQTWEQLVAEIIREKFVARVVEELPHSIAVVVDDLEVPDDPHGLLQVAASIFVERDSQKGIVIGKGGHLLREGNTQARQELEAVFGRRVFLDVRVRVARDWQRDPHRLERFGY